MESFSITSTGKMAVPIRRMLLPVMAAILLVMFGSLALGVNMSGRIQAFAYELEEQTLKN